MLSGKTRVSVIWVIVESITVNDFIRKESMLNVDRRFRWDRL